MRRCGAISASRGPSLRIHQLLASLEFGDAVAREALAIQRQLRAWGHASEIFVGQRHPRATEATRVLEDLAAESESAVLYHHAFWSERIDRCLREYPGPIGMVYHNITPAHFFAPYNEELQDSALRARAALEPLRTRVVASATASDFNRRELEALGFSGVGILPFPLELEDFLGTEPDPGVLSRYSDGQSNFLFVGRLAPNKRQEDVIRVFGWYHRFVNAASRLLLVGAAPEIDAYREDLLRVAQSVGVADAVVFAGKVTFAELVAYYRVADLFLCMSEHEGFCAPLIEAMAFDVPVLARDCGAVGETLGDAGILLPGGGVPPAAEAAALLLSDASVRRAVLQRQRMRLATFSGDGFVVGLRTLVARLLAGEGGSSVL